MTSPNSANDDLTAARAQFSLASLFWLLLALGLYLAYLRPFGPSSVLFGCLAVILGLSLGALCGWLGRSTVDSIYWGALCAAFAYVSVASEPAFGMGFRFAWTGVGAAAGALCGMPRRGRIGLRMLLGAIAGGLVMGMYVAVAADAPREKTFDALCAPIVGALVGLLIAVIQYVELDRRLPRYTIATWLLCAVLVGNILSLYWV